METVTETIELDVPVRTAYDQWTQFESFPQFMDNVESVAQLTDTELRWDTSIAGSEERFSARITDQVPDDHIAWTTLRGDVEHHGKVSFEDLGESTRLTVELEHDPEGGLERLGSLLGLDTRAVKRDVENFKSFIEDRGQATGAWRGEIRNGSVTAVDADNPRTFETRAIGSTAR